MVYKYVQLSTKSLPEGHNGERKTLNFDSNMNMMQRLPSKAGYSAQEFVNIVNTGYELACMLINYQML
jgi:hypothetical protein